MEIQYPQDFIQQIRTLFGEESEFFLASIQQPAITSVRLNPFKSTQQFNANKPIPWVKGGYQLASRPEFIFDPLFHAGAYYVQESSSMFLEHVLKTILPAQASVKILDMCAAPGGKSTLISSLLKPTDLLVSNEIIKGRVGVLEENLTKWGQPNCVITNNDPKDFASLNNFFDIIIIDAPCSGEGLFRRDKNAIKEWSSQNVALCEMRQRRIVADALACLKPEGFLIYSTCTFNTAENEENVKWMMKKYDLKSIEITVEKEWNITSSLDDGLFAYRFLPHKVAGEGFFIACTQKQQETSNHNTRPFKRKGKLNKPQLVELHKWMDEPHTFEYLQVGEQIHAIPFDLIESVQHLQHHLYLKKAGILMGSFSRDSFIPEHQLALCNQLSQSVQRLEISKDNAIRYLRKDNLTLEASLVGWTVLTYQQLALGWVKILPNRINNYLPSHLRILNEYTYTD